MADQSLIVSRMQDANIVVKKYAQDIDNFRENAKADFNNIKTTVNSLGNHWKGDLYDSFKRNMDSHLNQMQKCINGLDDLSRRLDKISKNFADAIAMAKKSVGE